VSEEEPPNPGRPGIRTTANPALQALAFATVYLIWGSTYLGIRVAVRTMPPFLMAGTRYLLAGAILFAALRALGVAAPTLGQWVRSGAAGVVMLAVGNGLVTWAEQKVPSNFAALLISAVPLYVALLEWARPRGVRPPAHQIAGILVGAAGMTLLVWPDPGALAAPSTVGIVAVLISGFAWAAGTLYARYSPHHPNAVMAAITWPSFVAFLYLAIFGSLVAFSAFGWLVTVSTPARLSTTAFVNPVVAVILGWALLGETLASRALAGASLIVCAVVVMTVGISPLRRLVRYTARPE
jgi:drug/metabolite transporter (DMT)-like permease